MAVTRIGGEGSENESFFFFFFFRESRDFLLSIFFFVFLFSPTVWGLDFFLILRNVDHVCKKLLVAFEYSSLSFLIGNYVCNSMASGCLAVSTCFRDCSYK